MRKDIFLAIPAAGIFFFGAAALLAVLTQPQLAHWNVAFWIGVICTPLGLANVLILVVWEFSDPTRRAKRPIVGPTLLINFATCILVLGIVWHFSATGTLQAISPGPLAGLSNAQLRERTIAFAQSLRDLESRYHSMETQMSYAGYIRRRSLPNDADKIADVHAETAREMALMDQREDEFRNKYRSDGLIIRDELTTRLGTLPIPRPGMEGGRMVLYDSQIFDKPFLAGPAPLSGGADLLEYWAKMLP